MASSPVGRIRKTTSQFATTDSGERPSLSLPSRRRAGSNLKFPIALKFTIFIAVLVVVSMAWLSHTATREAMEQLDVEINENGIQLVTSLCLLIQASGLEGTGEHRDLQAQLEEICDSPGMEKVQDIVVYNISEDAILTSAKSKQGQKVTVPRPVAYAPAARADVRIREREVDGVPVRSFSKVLRGFPALSSSDERRPLGRLAVFLSVQEILEARAQLSGGLMRVSVIACLAAAFGSFLLGSFLTRPIRALARDMKQVSKGDLQHQSRVDSADEIGDLARTFNVMTSNLHAAQATKLAQKAMEHELAVATRIQTRLLPSSLPTDLGVDLAALYHSAKEVGGDYYDFIPVDSDHVGMVVADVSGKGVPGSLVMTMTRSLLRMAAKGIAAPGEVIRQVNQCLSPDMNPGMFVTLLYMVVNKTTREVRMVRAGHNAPLLYNARHGKVLHLQPRGIAIGLDHGGSLFHSELETQRFFLRAGDILVAYTDGIVEGKDRSGRDYGDERFTRIIAENHKQSAQQIVDAVVKDLRDHEKGAEQSDDITLLVIKAE